MTPLLLTSLTLRLYLDIKLLQVISVPQPEERSHWRQLYLRCCYVCLSVQLIAETSAALSYSGSQWRRLQHVHRQQPPSNSNRIMPITRSSPRPAEFTLTTSQTSSLFTSHCSYFMTYLQYKTIIKFRVKNAYGTAVNLRSIVEKRRKTSES